MDQKTSQDSSQGPSRPAAGPLATLSRTLIWVSLPFGILNFVLPIYGRQVGASAVEIGLLFSVFSLMTVVLRPLVGAGLDRFGRRWFYIGGLAAYGLAMLAFAFSSVVWGLVIARALQGAGASLMWLSATAIVADLAQADQRGRSFGGISQSINQGAILGTFIGFSVLFPLGIEAGWKWLFLGYTLTGLLAAGMAWRNLPETLARRPGPAIHPLAGLRTVLRSRALALLMMIGLVTGASSAMISPILMIFLQEKFQAGVEVLAWAFLPSALVWAVLPTRLGRLADRYGRKPVMLTALAAGGLSSLLIPLQSSLVALAGIWAVEAVCFAASDPAGQALVTDLTDERQRGQVFGLLALAGGLGAVIGPLAGGWLYDTYSHAAPFYANALVVMLSAGALLVGLPGQAKSHEIPAIIEDTASETQR